MARELEWTESMPRYCRELKQGDRILVAVDLNEKGGELVTWALTQAARSGGSLSILHVTTPRRVSMTGVNMDGWGREKQDMLNTLSALVSYCRTHYVVPKLSISVQVVESESVADAIVAEARNVKATMTILGKSRSRRLRIMPKHMSDLGRLCVRKLSPYCHVLLVREGKVLARRPGTARSHRSLEMLLNKQQQSDEETGNEQLISSDGRSSSSDLYIDLLGTDEADIFDPQSFWQPSIEKLSPKSSFTELQESKCLSPNNNSVSSGSSSGFRSDGSPNSVLDRVLKLSHGKSAIDRICRWPHFDGCVNGSSTTCSCEQPRSSPFSCFTGNPSPPSQAPSRNCSQSRRLSRSSSRSSQASPQLPEESASGDPRLPTTFSPPPFARTCSEVRYALTEDGLRALQRDLMVELPGIRRFCYDELRLATNDFDPANVVGTGAASSVYKGRLRDGGWVAVKRLADSKSTGEKEFMIEIMMLICTLHHPNLVTLIGFCMAGTRRLLVYEFLRRGNLEQNLHGIDKKKMLTWAQRQKAAVGASRGLAYLHGFRPRPIIHRDVKASNILLSESCEAQVSDFGLARWLSNNEGGAGTEDDEQISCAGTFGYMAPECFMYANFDERTDVYAFGVVLLELISGRKPIDRSLSQQSLVQWARRLQKDGAMHLLVDSSLRDIDPQQFKRMMYTALQCIEESPEARPSMNRVLELLDPQCDSCPPLLFERKLSPPPPLVLPMTDFSEHLWS